ncbi:MAG: TonB-dependent receptor [Balneolaceae bacterium]|nr:MAG: TonB-dependent receptor [Balneolaceae bacterium]
MIPYNKLMFSLLLGVFIITLNSSVLYSLNYTSYTADERITVSGTVVDASTGQSLAGVNVVVRGTVVGVATNLRGEFTLRVNAEPPITIVASIIGYTAREFQITEQNVSGMRIELREETILGADIVVSASRVEESILDAPVSIEKMDIIAINQSASPSYYHALANLKGVDITTSSINFQIVNARGFNSTGNTRMVQLTDGMDTQAPALNFPIGNLNGPSVLDVESVEFIPGAASALYGPNAFNGILLVNSKSPIRYPGLSVYVQNGFNHIGGDSDLGEPGNPRPMFETSIRYAKPVSDRFAFKLNFSYSQADDWRGINYIDKNASLGPSGVDRNPAYDGVHLYGDDGTFNIGLLSLNPDFITGLTQGLVSSPLPITPQDAQLFARSIPSQPVARTGYREEFLVDNDAKNLKLGGSLHYRISDNLEASYTLNYGAGTSVYSGAQRYSLKDFFIHQHKLEFVGDNFMIRGYGTFEDSGDSYIADFVGFSINDQYRNTTEWFTQYGANMVQGLVLAYLNQFGTTEYSPQNVQALLGNASVLNNLHDWARNGAEQFGIVGADAGRFEPGTPEFENAFNNALNEVIPRGAKFNDQSRFMHVEGQYDFKNEIDFIDLQAGLSFRQYQLRSNGTIFADEGGLNINEYGGYVQGAKSLLDDRLRLTASLRYDKNENFDGQFNPRISSVIRVADSQNLRASYQTGFRFPTTQGQYIDLDVLTARLLGGLNQTVAPYNVTDNAFTLESVDRFTSELLRTGDPITASGQLVPYTNFEEVKPEQIQSFEIGYKGLLGNRLLIDAAYYYNIYNDFIAQFRVRKAAPFTEANAPAPPFVGQPNPATLLSGNAQNTFQLYTNVDETVKSQGAVFGFDYSLPRNFLVSANYNWNQLITEQRDGLIFDFNTPEHKVNLSFGNRRLTNQIGFNLTWRWQDSFNWTSSFASGEVPSISTLDAQVSYRIPNLKSVVKLGGSNIANTRYVLNYGGPNLGAIYYVSFTFDQFLN